MTYSICDTTACTQGKCGDPGGGTISCSFVPPKMVQGFFCPAAMQQGSPSKIDNLDGKLSDHRAYGECNIPQTPSTGALHIARHATTTPVAPTAVAPAPSSLGSPGL